MLTGLHLNSLGLGSPRPFWPAATKGVRRVKRGLRIMKSRDVRRSHASKHTRRQGGGGSGVLHLAQLETKREPNQAI